MPAWEEVLRDTQQDATQDVQADTVDADTVDVEIDEADEAEEDEDGEEASLASGVSSRRTYTREEKEHALILAETIGYSAAARQLGIPVDMLNNWAYKARKKLKRQAQKMAESDQTEIEKVSLDPKKRFLAYLREHFSPGKAARLAGISRSDAMKWRREDPAFAAAWDDIIETHLDELEREMFERARQPRSNKEKFDTLAGIFLLKGYRPERFADKVQHTGHDGGPINIILGNALPQLYRADPKYVGSNKGGHKSISHKPLRALPKSRAKAIDEVAEEAAEAFEAAAEAAGES